MFDQKDPSSRRTRRRSPTCSRRTTMPSGCETHLRYPRGPVPGADRRVRQLPRDRARRASTTGNDRWLVSPDPGSGAARTGAARRPGHGAHDDADRPAAGQLTSTGARIDPYLPVHQAARGRPSRASSSCSRSCRCRAGNQQTRSCRSWSRSPIPSEYGELEAFAMPTGTRPSSGPVQVNNDINTDAEISSQLTLLNQQGSTVIQGSMQLIPVGDSLIYVRPIYVESARPRQLPAVPVRRGLLRRAQAGDRRRRVEDGAQRSSRRSRPSTADAGRRHRAGEPTDPTDADDAATTPTTAPAGTTVEQLVAEANAAVRRCPGRAPGGRLRPLRQLIEQVGDEDLDQAQAAAGGSSAATPTTTTTPATPATTSHHPAAAASA